MPRSRPARKWSVSHVEFVSISEVVAKSRKCGPGAAKIPEMRPRSRPARKWSISNKKFFGNRRFVTGQPDPGNKVAEPDSPGGVRRVPGNVRLRHRLVSQHSSCPEAEPSNMRLRHRLVFQHSSCRKHISFCADRPRNRQQPKTFSSEKEPPNQKTTKQPILRHPRR